MVDGMKTIAIQFALTLRTALSNSLVMESMTEADPSSDQERLFRIVVDPITDVEVFWREKNALNEDIWRGGHHDSGPPPMIGGVYVERTRALAFAIRLMIEALAQGLSGRPEELPNGATVFYLGTA